MLIILTFRKSRVAYALMHQFFTWSEILGGRLGAYRYLDMDIAIKNALELAEKL